MLDFATANPDIQIVLRPHPFLWGTLTDRKVLTENELTTWRSSWDKLANTHVDEDGSYAELFLATDILITDGISFLGEYPLVTGKPSIFFENEDHWQFTATGEMAAEASIMVTNFSQLESVILEIRNGGLPDRSLQIQKLIAASSPYPGESAKRIVEQVYLDYSGAFGPSPLVDKSSIHEVAWELVAGREPFED
jgi:CDP-glycerol glycerophosphotransferase (TagB/SpsB family)